MSNVDDSYYENYKKSLENKGDITASTNSASSSNRFLMPLGLVALGIAGYLGYTMYPTPSATPFKDQNTEQKKFFESIEVEKKALATLSDKVVIHDENEALKPSVVQKKTITPADVSIEKENRDRKPANVLAHSSQLKSIVEKETDTKTIDEKKKPSVPVLKKTDETKVTLIHKIEKNVPKEKKTIASVIPKTSVPVLKKTDETKITSVNTIEKNVPNVSQDKNTKEKVIEKESFAQKKRAEEDKPENIKKEDEELLSFLSQAPVDSVKPSTVKTEMASKKTKSKKTKQQKKKVDTYNKVVSVENNANDALSKLSQLMSDAIKAPKDTTSDKSKTYTSNLKKEVATRVNEMRIIVVKKGDTLGSLALKAYGNVMDYPKIFAANSDILENPDKISIGQKIRIPKDIVQKKAKKRETTL